MSSENLENPVMLWGDMGPDVYQLSQIYDPRNDRYVLTQDTAVVASKTYYQRLSLILTNDETLQNRNYYKEVAPTGGGVSTFVLVTDEEKAVPNVNPREQKWYQDIGGKVLCFTEVTNPIGNPYEKHWYEVNPDAVNTCGKYVPAVDSLVVVDATESLYKVENHYKPRMLLTVKSVDDWFNVTFANVVFGSETDETVRAIDYGNEKFMLFFERRGSSASYDDIFLTVDRKVLLYGTSSYAYRLKRNGEVITNNDKAIQLVEQDGLVPFIRATAKRCAITTGLGGNYERLQQSGSYFDVLLSNGLSRTIQLPANKESLVLTFDTRFRANKNYYSGNSVANKLTEGTDYTVGQAVSEVSGGDVYCKAIDDLNNRVAFQHTDPSAASGNVFLPERAWLSSGMSLVDGEAIEMEIFMIDSQDSRKMARLCMTLTLTAKEATPLDQTDVTTRQIVSFDVELNNSETQGDIWYLQQGDDWKQAFRFTPVVRFDDGSEMNVPVDDKSCFMYGFENIKSKLVGREYQVLFKFFPHHTLNVNWQRIGITPTKHFITCRKTIKIINDMSYRIRKIAMIPAWDPAAAMYEFYFMVFRNDYESPPIIRNDFLDTKFLINAFKPTEDLSPVSSKTYYYKTNAGTFIPRTFPTGTSFPSGTTWYESTHEKGVALSDIGYYNNGSKMIISQTAAGDLMDVVQHAVLAERVYADGIKATNVYTQPIAFKLQRMIITSEPDKWIMGDDYTGHEEVALPYGNSVYVDPTTGTTRLRPFVVHSVNQTSGAHEFKIPLVWRGNEMFNTVELFMESFWNAAQPPNGTFGEENVETQEFPPTHIFFRSLNDGYKNDDDDATIVVESEPIPIGTNEDKTYGTKIELSEDGGLASEVVGGLIPVKDWRDPQSSSSNTIDLYGTVIVQFVHQYVDPEDPTVKKYKHLYAVPVEVRPE